MVEGLYFNFQLGLAREDGRWMDDGWMDGVVVMWKGLDNRLYICKVCFFFSLFFLSRVLRYLGQSRHAFMLSACTGVCGVANPSWAAKSDISH